MSIDPEEFLGVAKPAPEPEPPKPNGGGRPENLDACRDRIMNGEGEHPSRSEATLAKAGEMRRANVDEATMREELRKDPHVQSLPPEAHKRAIERVIEKTRGQPLVLSKSEHYDRAQKFITNAHPMLRQYRGDLRDLRDGFFAEISEGDCRAELAEFLRRAKVRAKDGSLIDFPVSQQTLGETYEALKNIAQRRVPDARDAPFWLDDAPGRPPADQVLAFPNGILDLRTDNFLPPSEQLFTLFACGFNYDPSAVQPARWLKFLDEAFEGDADQIALLQEVLGYALSSDTRHQKIFLIVGPPRSGKGTIIRTLVALCAAGTCCHPTLHSLGDTFGKQQLIGKQNAIIGDVRVGTKTDFDALAEALLSISGGDGQSVNRKFKEHWHGPLPVRFHLVSNRLPKLIDDTGVLATRFVTLETRTSFLGREDKDLMEKLRPELPGILLWALDGYRRLRVRDQFSETKVSRDAVTRLARSMSQVTAWAEECAEFGAEFSVATETAFDSSYKPWATANGLPPGQKNTFTENLRAAFPQVQVTKSRAGGALHRVYSGMRLRGGNDALPF